jgi:nitrous oxide reductase accessory protein NosL
MKKIATTLALLITLIAAGSSPMTPFNVGKKYFLNFDKNTTCLVRQIQVYKEPKWIAKIKTRSGKSVYFCSPKSMFEFYFRPGKWYDVGVRSERDFSEIVVTDFKTLEPINAEEAFFVYGAGSSTSPAGDDLPAFKSRSDAEAYTKQYNGKRIMPFDKVSNALIKLLNGRI